MSGPLLRRSLVLLMAGALPGCGEPAAKPLHPETLLRVGREMLTSPDVSVRRAAAKRLEEGVDLYAGAIVALGVALSDTDRWVRESAARALARQGPGAVTEVERLIAALKDEDPYVRWRVAEALGRVGPGAAAARAALAKHAEDPDEVEVVRAASVKALERIGGAGAPK